MTIKEQHVSEFSGFPFCLKYSRLVVKEAVTQKHQTAQRSPLKSAPPPKILHFQAKGPGKRLAGQKHLDNNCSTSAKQHRKTVSHLPASSEQEVWTSTRTRLY